MSQAVYYKYIYLSLSKNRCQSHVVWADCKTCQQLLVTFLWLGI